MVKWKVSIVLAIVLSLLFLLLSYDYPLKQRIFALSKTSDDLLQITLVFIHIQKTAGSEFERAIVRRLNFANHSSCRCPVRWKANRTRIKLRCNCTRNGQPWLISRFSVGWLCGVHADWTTYHRCLPHKLDLEYGFYPRKFLYATLLREPIARFISEYLHSLRGATWLSERLPCIRAHQLRNEYACWNRTDLNEFISCPFNSAINRQTRMLSTIHPRCSSIQIDLESAKENLRSMEFFGLTEYLSLSQRLFERTSYCQIYRICSFQSYLEQDMQANQTSTYLREHLTSIDLKRLRDMNSDDVLLYDYAKELFFHRTCQILGVACQ